MLGSCTWVSVYTWQSTNTVFSWQKQLLEAGHWEHLLSYIAGRASCFRKAAWPICSKGPGGQGNLGTKISGFPCKFDIMFACWLVCLFCNVYIAFVMKTKLYHTQQTASTTSEKEQTLRIALFLEESCVSVLAHSLHSTLISISEVQSAVG